LAAELIFILQQQIEMFDTYHQRISECDQQLQKHLAGFADHARDLAQQSAKPKPGKNLRRLPPRMPPLLI
jgi:hypothetical protein